MGKNIAYKILTALVITILTFTVTGISPANAKNKGSDKTAGTLVATEPDNMSGTGLEMAYDSTWNIIYKDDCHIALSSKIENDTPLDQYIVTVKATNNVNDKKAAKRLKNKKGAKKELAKYIPVVSIDAAGKAKGSVVKDGNGRYMLTVAVPGKGYIVLRFIDETHYAYVTAAKADGSTTSTMRKNARAIAKSIRFKNNSAITFTNGIEYKFDTDWEIIDIGPQYAEFIISDKKGTLIMIDKPTVEGIDAKADKRSVMLRPLYSMIVDGKIDSADVAILDAAFAEAYSDGISAVLTDIYGKDAYVYKAPLGADDKSTAIIAMKAIGKESVAMLVIPDKMGSSAGIEETDARMLIKSFLDAGIEKEP